MHREGEVTTEDGLVLHVRSWAEADSHASLVLVHGLAEHSGRYRETAEFFASRGFAVHAFDHRGHGRSSGRRVHVDSFDDYGRDLRAVLRLARDVSRARPLALLGHSQGGLVALTHALQEPNGLSALLLSSPFLGVAERSRPSPALAALARVVAAVRPRTLFRSGVDPALLSRDPEVGRAYAADPLVSGTVSAGWFQASLAALANAHERAPALAVPTLVLYAGADALVDPEATARFVANAPRGLVEALRYDGLYHEILNAPERQAVLARMHEWLVRTAG